MPLFDLADGEVHSYSKMWSLVGVCLGVVGVPGVWNGSMREGLDWECWHRCLSSFRSPQIRSQGKNLGAGGLCGQGSPEAGKRDGGSETEKEKKTIQEVLTPRHLCEWVGLDHLGTSGNQYRTHLRISHWGRKLWSFCSLAPISPGLRDFLGYFLLPNSFRPDLSVESACACGRRVSSGQEAREAIGSMVIHWLQESSGADRWATTGPPSPSAAGPSVLSSLRQSLSPTQFTPFPVFKCFPFCPRVTPEPPPHLLLPRHLDLHWPCMLVY